MELVSTSSPMKSLRNITFFLLCTLMHLQPMAAQFEWSTWVFGHNGAISFVNDRGRIGDPRVIAGPAIRQEEGTAVFCHPRRGTLELFTDDAYIRDGSGTIVPPSGKRGFGSSSAQAALFLPVPGDPNKVYCIEAPDLTSPPPYPHRSYHYSRLERSHVSAPWRVVDSSVVLSDDGTERIAATFDVTNARVVIATFRESGSVDFWHITAFGLTRLVFNHKLASRLTPFAQTKWSRDGQYLVIADSVTRILQVNHDVMQVRNVANINIMNVPALQSVESRRLVYGAAISPNNNFLYLSIRVGSFRGYLMQFDLRNGMANAEQSGVILATFDLSKRSWPPALQNGPDGRIYLPNEKYLGCIQFPDRWGLECGLDMNNLHLGGGRALDGLPTVVERFFSAIEEPKAELSHSFACTSQALVLKAIITGEALDTVWYVPGLTPDSVRGTATLQIPDVPAGTYVAYLTMTGPRYRVVDSIELSLLPGATYSIPRDTTVCAGSDIHIATSGIRNVQWLPASAVDNAQGTRVSLRNLQQDVTLVVKAVDERECDVSDTIYIRVRHADVALTVPPPACTGVPVVVQPQRGYVLQWLEGASPSQSKAQTLIVVPTERTVVVAEMTDGFCIDTVTAVINISPPPSVAISPSIIDPVCPGTPVRLRVFDGIAWQWDDHEDLDRTDIADPLVAPTTTTTYAVTVYHADGCVSRDSVTIETIDTYPVFVRVLGATLDVGGNGIIRLESQRWYGEHAYGVRWPRGHLWFESVTPSLVTSISRGVEFDTLWLNNVTSDLPPTIEVRVLALLGPLQRFAVQPVLKPSDHCAKLQATDGVVDATSCGKLSRLVRYTSPTVVRNVTNANGTFLEGALDPIVSANVRVFTSTGQLVAQTNWHGMSDYQLAMEPSWGTVVFAVVETAAERIVLPVVLR